MELDYIENVNGLEEHIVRLYNFNMAEAIQFRALLIETIMENQQPLDLTPSNIIGGFYLKNTIPFGLTGNPF